MLPIAAVSRDVAAFLMTTRPGAVHNTASKTAAAVRPPDTVKRSKRLLILARMRLVVRHLQMAEDHLKPLALVHLIDRSAMLGLAMRVVGKALNHPAGRNSPA